MKYLTLILALSTGEVTNTAMPAHDCYAAAATMHHAWSVGGRVDRGWSITDDMADCHHGRHAVLMVWEGENEPA